MRRGFLLAVLAAVMLWAPSTAVSAELILGSDTVQATAHETSAGYMECARFVANETGKLTEILLRTDATANTGVTKVVMGIESEGSTAPSGTVLFEGEYVGTPAVSSYSQVNSVSLVVSRETPYWMCWLPIGGALHFDVAVASGGTPIDVSTVSTFTKLGSASWTAQAIGPLYFYGIGTPFTTVELAGASAAKLEAVTAEVKAVKAALEGTLKVSCTGCSGGGSGGEVTLSEATRNYLNEIAKAIDADLWFLAGAFFAGVGVLILYGEIRPRG